MNSPDRTNSSSWKHPLALSLLKKYEGERRLEEIIEVEVLALLDGLKAEFPSQFIMSTRAVPVEAVASALNFRTSRRICQAGFSAMLKKTSGGYEISQQKDQHYYRQRFSLAHEIGHVMLSKLAGPLSNRNLHGTKGRRYEEEAMCDLFASALLMPKANFEAEMAHRKTLSDRDITSLGKEFRVSKGTVLRRIASLQKYVLLLWDFTQNPRQKKSKSAERIMQVYPLVSPLATCFIPLYCTLDNDRFSPNIVLESFHTGLTLTGHVRIAGLGSMPPGEYFVHNIPFQKWNENMLHPNMISKPKHFFNMATFIRARTEA